MPEVQRSESLRSANEGETGDLPNEVHTTSIIVETRLSAAGSPVANRKLPERSVSFNRDVHVKRIGRGGPRVTAALVGDGEGRLIATPVHKESITSRSKEDLALEAAHVLEQVGNVNCVARDNRRLPGKFSTLPARRNTKRSELALETRRRSVEIGSTNEDSVDTPRAKKKALERSASDASSQKLKSPLAKFFSPKLERKWKPTVKRSVSDAGATSKETRSQRKRSGSDSESVGTQQNGSRAKKPLSPIIEASPQIDKPFDFTDKRDPTKFKQTVQLLSETQPSVEELTRVHEILIHKPPKSPPKSPDSKRPLSPSVETRKSVYGESSRNIGTSPRDRSPVLGTAAKLTIDEVDQASVNKSRDMLHSSRYDQQQHSGSGAGEESSTIHKMIHRLTADRSPPPQLTRTMVSPSPGFGHNNNRPFSYTRPNNSSENNSPSPPHHHQQSSVIYAQVQMDKKNKAQRSHSDSDEGLGLERKDSSRENSPAEKEYRRTTEYTNYGNDLRRNNEINSLKSSRYVDDVATHKTTTSHIVGNNFPPRTRNDSKSPRRHGFDDIDRSVFDRPAEKYTSTVFVDTSGRGTADGMDSRRRENVERFAPAGARQTLIPTSKTSELSARRDLLESRIKSRLHTDDMFPKSNGTPVAKKMEHEIIDKPIVPSPITPNRVASPKRYTETYITETRTKSNGEKYIFEKEIHEDNGKVYGYEKKITNKIPGDSIIALETKPRNGYTVETRTDKYGDKYIVETRTHEGYADGFKPFLSDKSRNSPEGGRFPVTRNTASPYKSTNYIVPEVTSHHRIETPETIGHSSPQVVRKIREHKFSKSEDFLDRETRPSRDPYVSKSKKNFESIRGMSKSTQRLDEVGENSRVKALRNEYITRSHENLSSADYVNGRDIRRDMATPPRTNGRKERTTMVKRHLEDLCERPNDDYDTDISQLTNSQLESSKYYKETRTTQRYSSSKANNLHDDYDSSPPRLRKGDHRVGGYSSSRYDSDTTARDSTRCESRYVDEISSTGRKEHPRKLMIESEPKKPLRRSRNRLDYFDDSDTRESSRGKSMSQRLETFDESPTMPERVFHDTKVRHLRHETRGHVERRNRETRLSDTDRKDRLADSGIENDYRRDSQEADRRETLESDDEGFVTTQFIKHERRHTDRNMNLTPSERRKYDKYIAAKRNDHVITSKPPTGTDKKYEKKVAKKSGTMSKVKQLFSKKEKKAKEEKSKSKSVRGGSSGALTDDEVTMRYREYRGDQLRSARSARDLESDVNQEDYSQRRRLSTPSGSPSPARPARLSRSTGTLTRDEESFCDLKNTLTRDNQGQEAERKGWFKSLSRKNKTSAKPVDKKPRIPESEILTTGTEDEEASSAPERVSVQKNLRFFGDTDQESLSSNRERRSKRSDDHASTRCDVTISSSRQNLSAPTPPRKPPRLAESALSSGESTTGDSSQQSQNSQRSQRSVVYLHAATVGEIPGPNERRRAASRDELNRPLQSHTKTVSRSVSVLAPWKPRHYREPFEINYDQQQHHQKPPTTMKRRQRSRETLSRRGKEPRRSKDNLSKTGTMSRSTLKSKDKQKVDRTVSTESLASKSRNGNSRGELSRSTSVPRDPNKSAGWFKIKSKKSRA